MKSTEMRRSGPRPRNGAARAPRARRRGVRTVGTALCAAAMLFVVAAPERSASGDPGRQVPPGTGETVALPDTIELPRLLDLCALHLGLDIQYDRGALGNQAVTLRLQADPSADELWNLTNELLSAAGFATIVAPGSAIVNVVKINDAQVQARVEGLVSGEDAPAGFVNVLIELEHVDAKVISDGVKTLLSKPGGSVTAIGDRGLVLLSDTRPRLDQLLAMIDRLDVPRAPAVLEGYFVTNIEAGTLTGLAKAAATTMGSVDGNPMTGQLVAAQDGTEVVIIAPADEIDRWLELLERFDRRQAVTTVTYSPPSAFPPEEVQALIEESARDEPPRGSGERWRITIDTLTGSFIATATPAEHERIAGLLQRLEELPDAARRPMRTFPIRNRNVTELMDVLAQLLDTGAVQSIGAPTRDSLDTGRGGDRQSNARGGLPEGADPVEPPRMNQAPGTSGRTDTSGSRLRGQSRDSDPAAITIGSSGDGIVLTADPVTSTILAMGDPSRLKQLEELIEMLDVRQPQVMLEVVLLALSDDDTLDLGVELEKIEIAGSTEIALASLFGLRGGDDDDSAQDFRSGTGGTALVLDPGSFTVLVRALETINEGRSLNRPKVLVKNNEQAILDSVLQQPLVSLNASNTVATTSFSGTQDAGTSLTVRPQIAAGENLLLEYSFTLSDFTGESTDPGIPPPRQQNTLESVVMIPDGYTVVLGGLEVESAREAVSKVPLLGDIPWLGELFKSRSTSTRQARFYVFIRASIHRRDDFRDLKYLSDQALIAVEVDDGWPIVEPRVIK